MQDDMPLIGLYIGGVIKPKMELTLKNRGENDIVAKKSRSSNENVNSVAQSDFPKLPSPIAPPTVEELKAMQAKLEKLKKPLPKVFATYFGEDWKTQGDWYGRITSEWAVLCAMDAPRDHDIFWSQEHYRVRSFLGPHNLSSDSLRYWLHWRRTDDRRSLWNPNYAFRRQAEWDDHGEVYSMAHDGPDVWYLLDIRHEGVFEVSMYFFNKDGHQGMNRIRDYLVQVYESPQAWRGIFEDRPKFAKLAESQASKKSPLATSRVRDFWGGVHKKFVLTGPGSYFFKIDSNYSFNTILSSVMVRQVHGEPTWIAQLKKDQKEGMPNMADVLYLPPPFPEKMKSREGKQTIRLWQMLDMNQGSEAAILLQRKYRQLAYVAASRLAKNGEQETQLAKSLAWRFNMWDEEQRKEYDEIMLKGWKKYFQTKEDFRKMIGSNRKRFPTIYKEDYYDEAFYQNNH